MMAYNKQMKGNPALIGKLHEIAGLAQSEQSVTAIRSLAIEKMGIGEKELSNFEPRFLSILVKRADIKLSEKVLPSMERDEHKLFEGQDFWRPNELKCFIWVSVCLAFISNHSLSQFDSEELEVLFLLFPAKVHIFLLFNLKAIQLTASSKTRHEPWTEYEKELLKAIVGSTSDIRWGKVCLQLYEQSHFQFVRTGPQCREQWNNHLNPKVNRGKWTLKEDLALMEAVKVHGMKWAVISKELGESRTDHTIKNRANAILKRYNPKKIYKTPQNILQTAIKDIKRRLAAQDKKAPKNTSSALKQEIRLPITLREQISSPYLQKTLLSPAKAFADSFQSFNREESVESADVFNYLAEGSQELTLKMLEFGRMTLNVPEEWQHCDYGNGKSWLDDDVEAPDVEFLKNRMMLCDCADSLLPTAYE